MVTRRTRIVVDPFAARALRVMHAPSGLIVFHLCVQARSVSRLDAMMVLGMAMSRIQTVALSVSLALLDRGARLHLTAEVACAAMGYAKRLDVMMAF